MALDNKEITISDADEQDVTSQSDYVESKHKGKASSLFKQLMTRRKVS
jgi:hypothetical protein